MIPFPSLPFRIAIPIASWHNIIIDRRMFRNRVEQMNELPTTAPPMRKRRPRLPDAARVMAVDEYIDVSDAKTAACVVSFGRYMGWTMVRRTGDGCVRVWRIE
jgi:hypothetical protein